jgi:hypothetical protein
MAGKHRIKLWDRVRVRFNSWVEAHIVAKDPNDPQLSQLDEWDGLKKDRK